MLLLLFGYENNYYIYSKFRYKFYVDADKHIDINIDTYIYINTHGGRQRVHTSHYVAQVGLKLIHDREFLL